MNLFLEVATCMGSFNSGEIFPWGLEKVRNVEFDLLEKAGVFQRVAQIGVFNVRESAA